MIRRVLVVFLWTVLLTAQDRTPADLLQMAVPKGSLGYPAQQEAAPLSPERSAWIGGQGTEPYEQKTQQSPRFGRSNAPQPLHS